jgi:uncharacterized delta-60 repeat protein
MRSGRMRAVGLVGVVALLLVAAPPAAAGPADPDPTFGSGGLAPMPFPATSRFNALTLDAQGRIVAAGAAGSPTAIVLARYTPTGQLDPSFGAGGAVTTPVAGGDATATAVAMAPNGDIVVAGRSTVAGNLIFTLARYTPSGALVTGFGSGGIRQLIELGTFSFGTGVTVLPDGNIAATGVDNGSPRFVVVRLVGSSGSLDPTFDGDGIARPPAACGGNSVGRGIVAEPDGAFVASGECREGSRIVFALAKFKAGASSSDAAVDTTFGSGGLSTIAFTPNFNEPQRGVARTADGRYLVSGQLQIGGSTSPGTFEGAIARFDHSGALDPTWGSGGKVQASSPGGMGFTGVAERADGTVVAAGNNFSTPDQQWVVAGFKQDGTPDSAFGPGGVAVGNPQPAAGLSFIASMVSQDGKPLVAGALGDAAAVGRFGRPDAVSSGGGAAGGAPTGAGALPLTGLPPAAGVARAGLPRSVRIDPKTGKGIGNATCQADPFDACAIAGRLQQGAASKLATAARRRKRKAKTVGAFAGRVPAGTSGRVVFSVRRRALRKLVAAGKLKVRATGQVRNAAGASTTIAQRLTLVARKAR